MKQLTVALRQRYEPITRFAACFWSLGLYCVVVGCGASGASGDNYAGSGGNYAGNGGSVTGSTRSLGSLPSQQGGSIGNGTGVLASGGSAANGVVGSSTVEPSNTGGNGGSCEPTVEQRDAAQRDIEAFLETRFDASPSTVDKLAQRLTEQCFSGRDVEALIRQRPSSFPSLSTEAPTARVVGPLKIDCYHFEYASTYYRYVPATYDPAHATPLVIVGHGGNSAMSQAYAESTALTYISSYTALADGTLGAILVAPATTVGWTPVGDSLIESVISQTIREYNVDPDRIFIVGQSMGGHLSWRSAINHGDRYAGFSPESGGYANYIDNHLIENVFGTVGYVTYGSTEPYELDTTNDLLGAWLGLRNYPWIVVKKDGGHEIYADEIPKIGSLFAGLQRDLYPVRTYLHAVGEMRYPTVDSGAEIQRSDRVLRWNFRNWIEVEPRPDVATGATFYGENMGNNRLEITTNGVRYLEVLLHPKMVDMSLPVTIVVNGEVKYAKRPELSLGKLIERVREFDDRGRIFYASVPIDITTDRVVPTPSYPSSTIPPGE